MVKTYIKKKDSPFEEEYTDKVKTFIKGGEEYLKIKVLYGSNYKKVNLVDITLEDADINKNAGQNTSWGIMPEKDFLPIYTNKIKEF